MRDDTRHMPSLAIAELTGEQHNDVLKAVRKMELAWGKTCGLKFQLTSRAIVQPNGETREVPCYALTKTECQRADSVAALQCCSSNPSYFLMNLQVAVRPLPSVRRAM